MSTTPPEIPFSGLVTTEELKQYMSGINLTPQQEVSAAGVLLGVQKELERYLNRPVQLVQVREAIQSDPTGFLNVSVSPVTKIINLTPLSSRLIGLTIPEFNPYVPTDIVRDPSIGENGVVQNRTLVIRDQSHAVPGAIYVGVAHAWYVAEYVGGRDCSDDASVKLGILRVAAREVAGNHDDTISLRQGDAEAAAKSDTREKGWTLDELRAFDRLRRRVVV